MILHTAPAYTVSNENQRWATQVVPNVKSVLTVAGSGDQALFYKLSGAKIVDTFDINNNARVIQDIKCAAIKHLKISEYKDLLTKLHNANACDIIDMPEMHYFLQFLPKESSDIIKQNNFACNCGLNIDYYPENIPTETEFETLKNMLDKSFNFIWTDLGSLGTQLTRKYDLINISNIFDYISNGQTQVDILNELSKHLDKNGHIVHLPQKHIYSYKKLELPHLVYEKTLIYDKLRKIILFQKTK